MIKKKMRALLLSATSVLTTGGLIAGVVAFNDKNQEQSKNNNIINVMNNVDINSNVLPIPKGPGYTPKTREFALINDVVTGVEESKYDNHVPQDAQANSEFYKKSGSWYDAGFMWSELLSRPWYDQPGVPSADGDTYLDKMLANQKMFNMGFITAYNKTATDEKIKAEPSNEYAKLLQQEADGNPDFVIPSISGVLSPVLLTNSYNWDGSKTVNLLDEIRKQNGDYKISFGGWNNYSLAAEETLRNRDEFVAVTALFKSYKAVVEATNARYLDFDIEGLEDGKTDDFGNTPLNPEQQVAAKKLRIQAIKMLKAEYPDLNITFTMPSHINGLGGVEGYSSEEMLNDAFNEGTLDSVNIMAFDYGQGDFDVSGNPRVTTPGEGALYSISSANGTFQALRKMKYFEQYTDQELWGVIGITSMNGRADVKYQINWATDAKILANFVMNKQLGGYYIWSAQKDIAQFARDDYSKEMDVDYGPGYAPDMFIYTNPLTIDQMMNYEDRGLQKIIVVDGQEWDINAALTSGVGAKDFGYTKITNSYMTQTKNIVDESLFNSVVFKEGNINSFNDIENFNGILESNIKYSGAIDDIYNGFINLERTNTDFYFK